MASKEEDERAERQARMSRALGAAFLAHQVNELERNVDTLSFKRGPPPPGFHRGGRGRGGPPSRGRGGGRGRGGPPLHREGPPLAVELAPEPAGLRSLSPQPQQPLGTPKRVVDASALLHALPVVKQWVRTGAYLVLVPQEAIVTLDLLKKGSTPLALAARDATRFLDNQFERDRLVGERDNESVTAAELEETLAPHLFSLAQEQNDLLPESLLEEEEVATPTAAQVVPRHLQSLLRFALYLSENARHPSEQPVIAYKTSEGDDERSTGAGVQEWAIACGLASHEISPDDVAKAKEETRAFHQERDAERERGRGRGRGSQRGRGRGRGAHHGGEGEPSHRKLFEP